MSHPACVKQAGAVVHGVGEDTARVAEQIRFRRMRQLVRRTGCADSTSSQRRVHPGSSGSHPPTLSLVRHARHGVLPARGLRLGTRRIDEIGASQQRMRRLVRGAKARGLGRLVESVFRTPVSHTTGPAAAGDACQSALPPSPERKAGAMTLPSLAEPGHASTALAWMPLYDLVVQCRQIVPVQELR